MAEHQPSESGNSLPFYQSDPAGKVVDAEYLIRQAFADDPRKGYELLFRRYYRSLCSQAVRFVYSRTLAEDVVSDVFFSFWKNQVYQRPITSYQAYLYMAVRKRSYSYLRAEFQQQLALSDADAGLLNADAGLDPEQLIQYTELYQRIQQTVHTLSPQCQRVFVMSRFEGKKHREIADELHISPKTIEAHLSRAIFQLRQALKLGLISFTLFAWSEAVINPSVSVQNQTVVVR